MTIKAAVDLGKSSKIALFMGREPDRTSKEPLRDGMTARGGFLCKYRFIREENVP